MIKHFIFFFIIYIFSFLCEAQNPLILTTNDGYYSFRNSLVPNSDDVNHTVKLRGFQRLVVNNNSPFYYLVSGDSMMTKFQSININLRTAGNILNSSVGIAKSDSLFEDFFSYLKHKNLLGINYFGDSDYKCSSLYCVSCGAPNVYDLMIYYAKPLVEERLFVFTDKPYSPVKIEFYKERYLLVLRGAWKSVFTTNLYVFDLVGRKLLHQYTMNKLLDIKVIGNVLYLVTGDYYSNQDSNSKSRCFAYRISKDNKFIVDELLSFDNRIIRIQ